MIIISDCSKNIVIPAGLGDNAGVVYETAGVKSLNGETGDVKIKTVNGNELTGDGNIEIKAGVSSVNEKTGDVTVYDLGDYAICMLSFLDITLSEADTDVLLYNYGTGKDNGAWNKYVDGDDTLQTLYIRMKDGGRQYKVPVEIHCRYDGQDNAVMHFTIGDYRYVYSQVSNMHWKFTSKTPVNSGGGSDSVIVLDNLTQEERKAVYDKMDKSVPPKEIFRYDGAVSFYTRWGGSNYLKIFFLDTDGYGGGRVKQWSLDPEGWFSEEGIGMNYPNFLFLNVGDHAAEGADFECGYTGDYNEFMYRPYTEPNGYFLVLKKGIGDSTKKMVLPLTVLWDKEYDGSENIPIRIQFTANEKLYTYLHGDADGKWLFESAKPITGGGGGATNALTYKQITNESRQEVYDDVKAHWSDASGYTGNYVYFYQKDKDQIIFDEVKFEGDVAFFNSAAINYTSGQVHNPLIRLLCCIVRAEGNVELAENDRVISDVNGMRYICSGEIKDGGNISFRTNSYGDGYDIYESTNTGGKDGMFDAQFENGIDGYKGNTPANIFTDGTDVFMAFDVVDKHYVYKKVDNSWVFVSKVKIGGVQSSEVSNIKVLTQSEYDTLTAIDPNTIYCIKG